MTEHDRMVAEMRDRVNALRETIRSDYGDRLTGMRAQLDQFMALCREAEMTEAEAAVATLWNLTPSLGEMKGAEMIIELAQPGRALAIRAAVLMELLHEEGA